MEKKDKGKKKTTEDKYRDKEGKFKKGNPGGPGNPLLRKQKEYRELFKTVLGKDTFIEIVKTMVEKAVKDKDYSSLKFIIEQCIGKPRQSVDISSPEDTARMAQKYLKKLQVNEVSEEDLKKLKGGNAGEKR